MKFRLTSETFLQTAETLTFLSQSVVEKIKQRPIVKYTDPNKSGGFLVVLFIIATLIVVFGTIYAIYACVKTRRSYRNYNKRPQTFIRHPNLNIIQQLNNQQYHFEPIKLRAQTKQVQIIKKQLMQGFIQQVTFLPSDDFASIKFSRKIEDTAYFQIQVLSNQAQISIGFIHAKEYSSKMKIDSEVGQVGIGISQTGLVKQNGIFMYNYQFKVDYGDTIGVGITKPQQRIWFTHNGKFLNPPTSIQLQQWQREAISQQNIPNKSSLFERIFGGNNQQKPASKQPVQVIHQHDIQRIQQRVKLNHETFQFYAVVSCRSQKNGYLNINSGGSIFRYAVPEFEKGLLLEQYQQKFCGWIKQLI